MRVLSRVALLLVVLLSTAGLAADHFKAECPLSLVDTMPAATDFSLSPHGVFRYGSLIFSLRGNVLTTYTSSEVGNLQIVREDFIGAMYAREKEGGAAFSNGYLYLSSEAGLEIIDLRNTRAGGSAPVVVSRTPGRHYRRLAVDGSRVAGLYPATDMPCVPSGSFCATRIDIFDTTSIAAPVLVGTVNSQSSAEYRGLNDIAFNYGYLMAVSDASISAIDITNPANPVRFSGAPIGGKWLVSNGTNFLALGNDASIDVFDVRPGLMPLILRTKHLTLPTYLTIERGNPIRFHPEGWWDENNGRLVTMIDEVDTATGLPARTIAFDVFDFSVAQIEGSVERIYEDVTMISDDEVKHDPIGFGSMVYVIGEQSGLQAWGACGTVAGRIELDSPMHLTCNGAEIHGWVTGALKIVNVELFLNTVPLGAATLSQIERQDVSSTNPVHTWRIRVNLDQTARGEYTLRAIGTDTAGTRRQFASQRMFFQGPGQNCIVPKRRAVR